MDITYSRTWVSRIAAALDILPIILCIFNRPAYGPTCGPTHCRRYLLSVLPMSTLLSSSAAIYSDWGPSAQPPSPQTAPKGVQRTPNGSKNDPKVSRWGLEEHPGGSLSTKILPHMGAMTPPMGDMVAPKIPSLKSPPPNLKRCSIFGARLAQALRKLRASEEPRIGPVAHLGGQNWRAKTLDFLRKNE